MATPSRNKNDYIVGVHQVSPYTIQEMYEILLKDYEFTRGGNPSRKQIFWAYVERDWALRKQIIRPKRHPKRRRISKEEMERHFAKKEGYTYRRRTKLMDFNCSMGGIKYPDNCKVCFTHLEHRSWKSRGMCLPCWEYRNTWATNDAPDYLATYFGFAERFRTGDVPKELFVASGCRTAAEFTYKLRDDDLISYEKQPDGQYDHWVTDPERN